MTQTMVGAILAILLSAFALGRIAQIVIVARTFRTRLLIGLAITGVYACGGVVLIGSALTPTNLVQSLLLLGLVFAGAAAERGRILIVIVAAILLNYAYLHLPDAVFAAIIAVGCILMVLPSRAKNIQPAAAAQNLYPLPVPPTPPQPAAAYIPAAPVTQPAPLPPATAVVQEASAQPKMPPSRNAMLDALDRAIASRSLSSDFSFDEEV
jgi:hypothetical protein